MEGKETERKGKGGGRPRSESTRRSILSATITLLQDESLQSITVEAIAREAGVSKATIYRWWSSKTAVAIDAFIENHLVKTPMPYDVHPAEALIRHWRLMADQYRGFPGRIVAQILAEGQSDPEIMREFRQRFHYGRRAVVREVIENLKAVHPLPEGLGSEQLMDMFYAPIYMRLLWGHAPIDDEFILEYPRSVMSLIGIHLDENDKVVAFA
ncbi:TetR family transcriptional regulator [Novosphingobium endophyticum]|uniref:TetR family transcriptional regulator n=1 Tax=Novosphingobium endophyticum TaxID=1955250 RepID=A0A916TS81_9SPHN|nr:TetR/AcrR family transcriptional regulator [Novosphingobium endophyticum]GGC01300.1 TetR family transcriptional regulator [Novosphingobium endophyticum]